MTSEALLECVIGQFDWNTIYDISGPAPTLPDRLRRLIYASTPSEREEAYWGIENHVFVGNSLFEAAVPVVSVLLAALTDPDRPLPVRFRLLDLLFLILNAESHYSEVQRGLPDLKARCHEAAIPGLWLLYRELFSPARAAALEVVEILETDIVRLEFVRRFSTP